MQRVKRVMCLITIGVSPLLMALRVLGQTGTGNDGGNEFYRVHVNGEAPGIGQFTITTGPSHPAGENLPLLFVGESDTSSNAPGSSYLTIHSFTLNRDYVQRDVNSVVPPILLDTVGVVTPVGTTGKVPPFGATGFRTTYDTGDLLINQLVNVNGTTFEDSSVEITTSVEPSSGTNAVTSSVGIRYLLDLIVGEDDGPTLQPLSPDGPVFTTETEFASPFFEWIQVEDNDVNPLPPTYRVLGTVNNTPGISPAPTAPSLLQFVSWRDAVATPFAYSIVTNRSIAVAAKPGETRINDSAVLYFFGHDAGSALPIPVTVSMSLKLLPLTPRNQHNFSITRTARFWFTHAMAPSNSDDTNCVTLLRAIQYNSGRMGLGFLDLPTTYHDKDNFLGAQDTLAEALSFYWKSKNRTGEYGGTQNAGLHASLLCRARKALAVELIAATANVALLGTSPTNCTYRVGTTTNSFPANLLQQARLAGAGEDVAACVAMTKLLNKFNNSGVTNSFFDPAAEECSVTPAKTLKKTAYDPTERDTCPGMNDSCETAEAVVNEGTTSFQFKRSVNTSTYTPSTVGDTTSTNSASGHLAWYKITPDVGRSNRWFTASTAGSNFYPDLTVWEGTCNSVSNSLSPVVNTINGVSGSAMQPWVQFPTDGTNNFFIIVGGGTIGRVNIKVTSGGR